MSNRASWSIVALEAVLAATVGGALLWAAEPDDSPRRARPPQWTGDVSDAFFDDARETLVGPRPDYERLGVAPNGQADTRSDEVGFAWSALIDAETIEDEVKRLAQAVARDATTPNAFKGGGYQRCRRHFSTLAVLFAVVGQYDGSVRWQDVAPGMRDLLARAGHNAKVGTDSTYREASLRGQDLAEVVRGSRPRLPPARRDIDWDQVADRGPLMRRLEQSQQERISPWLADVRKFGRQRDQLRHEAQLMAVIAEVIGREGFEYYDDEQYATYARDLRQAATEVAGAAEREDYSSARKAAGRATQACAACHEGYRG